MVNSAVKIGKIKMKNPVMAASGTFGLEYGELMEINSLGAFVMKTITLEPRVGNPPPRLVETASGMLNSIGLENKGLADFIRNKAPLLKKLKIPVIVSIAADSEKEFAELAERLSKVDCVAALELNLSCPNVRHGLRSGLIAQDEKAVYEAIKKVREVTLLTIIAKLSPNVTDITAIARMAEAAGADAVSMINTFFGMAVDIDTKTPGLGNITGGLSGPAIKPIALRMVYETFKKIRIPIIGIGGIRESGDALEFIICGASAVQVGTANFVDPAAAAEIIEGIEAYLKKYKVKNIKELVGSIKAGKNETPRKTHCCPGCK